MLQLRITSDNGLTRQYGITNDLFSNSELLLKPDTHNKLLFTEESELQRDMGKVWWQSGVSSDRINSQWQDKRHGEGLVPI